MVAQWSDAVDGWRVGGFMGRLVGGGLLAVGLYSRSKQAKSYRCVCKALCVRVIEWLREGLAPVGLWGRRWRGDGPGRRVGGGAVVVAYV